MHRAAFGMFLERERQSGEQGVCAKDAQHAVELMGEFDGFTSVAAMSGQGGQRDRLRAEGDGMIGGDDALVAEAEAAGEVEAAGQAAKVGSSVGGGTCEALIVVGAKAGEYGVGFRQSGGVSEAKFADQPVLTGAPGALDAALA